MSNLLRSALAVFAAFALTACGPSPEPAFPRAPYHIAEPADAASRIARITCSIQVENGERVSLDEAMRRYHVGGVSVAAMQGGKVIWARGFGMADVEHRRAMTPETVLQAASVSKAVTTVGVLRMVGEGELALDRDIDEYGLDWHARFKGKPAKITLRQLLSHTSGLNVHGFGGYDRSTTELPSTLDVLLGRGNSDAVTLEFAPGERSSYSGGGFTVVQAIVEREVDSPFDHAMYEWVITPFAMTHSTFEQPIGEAHVRFAANAYDSKGAPIRGGFRVHPEKAAAGLWTTPVDLLTLASGLASAYHGKSRLLSKKLVKTMLTRGKNTGDFGLGFVVTPEGDEVEAWHNGQNRGFTSMWIWRTDGRGVAVLVNGEGPIASGLAHAVAEEYGFRDGRPPLPQCP
ncbi:MAG: serine hydrolase domain-containing protein [Polyangiaceae bacterium]